MTLCRTTKQFVPRQRMMARATRVRANITRASGNWADTSVGSFGIQSSRRRDVRKSPLHPLAYAVRDDPVVVQRVSSCLQRVVTTHGFRFDDEVVLPICTRDVDLLLEWIDTSDGCSDKVISRNHRSRKLKGFCVYSLSMMLLRARGGATHSFWK